MIKQIPHTYRGMSQDVVRDKESFDLYYEGNNIRVITNDSQSQGGVSNEKGTTLKITLPAPEVLTNGNIRYGNKNLPFKLTDGNELLNSSLPRMSGVQKVISKVLTKDGFILFSTDNKGFDCIWEVFEVLEGNYDFKLLYCRNLGFSEENPIQAIYNYENEIIQKVYWVDGKNQLRFMNIRHSIENGDTEELIDLESSSINIVSDYTLSQIELDSTSGGGIHTSGMIQYAYNLYKINGSQTSLSPISDLIALDKGLLLGGGEVNEVIGTSLLLKIPRLDPKFDYIKIYAIKYTSFNQNPSISLIKDEKIDSYENYIFTDSGNSINQLSISEFLFLGSNPIRPKHIESKDNRLFSSNYRDTAYVLDIDCRAYSHNQNGLTDLRSGAVFHNGVTLQGGSSIIFSSNTPVSDYVYPTSLDGINPDYEIYRYQKDGSTFGGEGLFIKYELTQTDSSNLDGDLKYLRFFKDDEIYRIGIEFYNKLGQKTEVKWIADFKARKGNLEGNYNTLKVTIKKPEFDAYIASLNLSDEFKPVGYKIVRAERNLKDKTIICQGAATGMMIQSTVDPRNWRYWSDFNNKNARSGEFVKLPSLFSRGFSTKPGERYVWYNEHLRNINGSGPNARNHGDSEIYAELASDFKVQQTWQYNKMYQLFSPEVTFEEGISFGSNLEFKVKGVCENVEDNKFKQTRSINAGQYVSPVKENNTGQLGFNRPNDRSGLVSLGIIGPQYLMCDRNTIDHYLYNRKYTSFVENTGVNRNFTIYGSPEVVVPGQGVKYYNNDATLKYANTLEGVLSDGFNDAGCCCGGCDDEASIQGINSWGGKSLIIVEGNNKIESDRLTLKQLVQSTSINENINGLLMLEIKRPINYAYNDNIYEGLSVEGKSRASYIGIGSFHDIENNEAFIQSPGDTFVQRFRVGRILKTDTEKDECRTQQFSEIIEFPVETNINVLNRNDLSILDWDSKFQPGHDEYNQYNRVYSQDSNLVRSATDSTLVREVNNFDTRIISSKIKVPGENIDSWTDLLENEVMDLDGKYGPITSLVNFRDNIYALQSFATCAISINPRVQTQGSDGVSIELGTGSVLYDYNYISTTSGCENKWSVFTSPSGFYFIDIVNRNINRVSGEGFQKLSLNKRMNSFVQNNLDYNTLKKDNPFLKQGITGVYDRLHDTSLFTVLQGDNSFTLSYNEKTQLFESFYDYKPSLYVSRGFKLLSFGNDNNSIHEHFSGPVGSFYGEIFPSNITMQYHTQDQDSIFNNISFRSELKKNGIDVHNKSMTQIRAYNDYLDTGVVDLVLNQNIARKFRLWKANIPRAKVNGKHTLDRVRGQWFKLFLQFDNLEDQDLILHDTNLMYTSYRN